MVTPASTPDTRPAASARWVKYLRSSDSPARSQSTARYTAARYAPATTNSAPVSSEVGFTQEP